MFELLYRSKKSRARLGRITTPHGLIETPNFVAVGTNGTIKALDSKMVESIGIQLLFCNTYHLLLQPGADLIEKSGGLHRFMGRSSPIITDSGGFQVFSLLYGSVTDEIKSKGKSLSKNLVLKIDEEGVQFRSYRDGKTISLTPESSVAAQKKLGADIIIPFDELPPYHTPLPKLTDSLERTHRWEKRSLDYHKKDPRGQMMYGVIHGGVDPNLRKKSCDYLTQLPFDGFAIGGSFGRTKNEMHEMLSALMPRLPEDLPNHLLGIGDPPSIARSIPLGIDTFDSSYPTKAARHGLLFTQTGSCKIGNASCKHSLKPVDPECSCYTCQHYSVSYLHHLFKANELTAYSLASIHNLHYMVRMMERYRVMIEQDLI
ncbi:MAG: tRNA guanosine(34) transglycosylase Tgt [Chlamydiota bacterium]